MPTVTTAELADLLMPLVGAKRRGAPELNATVDISWGPCGSFIAGNADIRAVTAEGVKRFFWNRCETIAWPDVRSVTIRRFDKNGREIGQATFSHADFTGVGKECSGCGSTGRIHGFRDGKPVCRECFEAAEWMALKKLEAKGAV